MGEDPKNCGKEAKGCCEGMPFAEMMRKMKEAMNAGGPCNCAEMMSKMMPICCGAGEKKEEPARESKESPAPKP